VAFDDLRRSQMSMVSGMLSGARGTTDDFKLQARFGLEGSELPLQSYSCALRLKSSILLQGRMHIFPRHIGFASDLLGQAAKTVVIKLSNITEIKKAKTAMVLSNAILIRTELGESIFFTSFLYRNDAYYIIHDLWAIAKGIAAVIDGQENAFVLPNSKSSQISPGMTRMCLESADERETNR
jgi:hypothetical protein